LIRSRSCTRRSACDTRTSSIMKRGPQPVFTPRRPQLIASTAPRSNQVIIQLGERSDGERGEALRSTAPAYCRGRHQDRPEPPAAITPAFKRLYRPLLVGS
jgi:hypothetical protein